MSDEKPLIQKLFNNGYSLIRTSFVCTL